MSSCKTRFGRVTRPKLPQLNIDLKNEEVVLEGMTLLCFSADCISFKGNLQAKDESTYELRGICISRERSGSSESSDDSAPSSRRDSISEDIFALEEVPVPHERRERSTTPKKPSEKPHTCIYDVVVSDLEQGVQFVIPDVKVKCGQECLFTAKDVSFQTDTVYWGQKADIIILKHFGPDSVGKGCVVYAGALSLKYKDDTGKYAVTPENSSSWCM